MNERIARIPLAIASVLLSLGLWLYVQYQDVPNQGGLPSRFQVPLEATGLRNGLWALNVPAAVEFTAEGSDEDLAKIDPTKLVASVDLSAASPITDRNRESEKQRFTVVLKAPAEYKVTWKPTSMKVALIIEPEVSKTLPVSIDTSGALNIEQRLYNNAISDPESVTVRGPRSLVKQVVTARVILDLTKVRPQTAYTLPIELLEDNNISANQKVVSDPIQVTIRPSLTIAPTFKSLLVSPIFKGQPLFGYRVVSFEVFPNQVNIKGPSEDVAKLSLIETEPIDISGMSKTVTLNATLNLGPGLRAIDSNRAVEHVKVRLQIEAIPATPNTPTKPPPNPGASTAGNGTATTGGQ